jgi:hypothetical protein
VNRYVVIAVATNDDEGMNASIIWSQIFQSEKDALECMDWLGKYENITAEYYVNRQNDPFRP